MTYERARIVDCKCADRSCFGISSRHSSSVFLMLAALLALSCSLGPTPKQMYEGPPLPKEQVGIVRNGCAVETGLSIMVMHIDGKNVPDPCADFALLPGEHQIELSAKQLGPSLQTGTMRSGGGWSDLMTSLAKKSLVLHAFGPLCEQSGQEYRCVAQKHWIRHGGKTWYRRHLQTRYTRMGFIAAMSPRRSS